MTRYEITILEPGKYITTIIKASSIRDLAEKVLAAHPTGTFVSAKEL